MIEKRKNQMYQTWKKKEEARSNGNNEAEITQSNGLGDHTTLK